MKAEISRMFKLFASNISARGIAFLVLFGIVSIAHLIFCFLEQEKWRKITKPFCVFFLALAVLVSAPHLYLVYIGLFLGMIGDIFLIFKDKEVLLTIGTICFMVNHFFFIAQYIVWFGSAFAWYLYLIVGLVVALILMVGILFYVRKSVKKKIAFGGVLYFSVIFADAFFAFVALILGRWDYFLLNAIGMLFFLSSDIYLVKTIFIKDDKRSDFYIMGTYLSAQFFVTLGFLLTL